MFNRALRAELVDLRMVALKIAGQEILTKDKVALRIKKDLVKIRT